MGALGGLGGLPAALARDTPAGPSIIVVATGLFAAELAVGAVGAVLRGRVGEVSKSVAEPLQT